MGSDLLNQQIRGLQSRADRYRKIGRLLGDGDISATLNQMCGVRDNTQR